MLQLKVKIVTNMYGNRRIGAHLWLAGGVRDGQNRSEYDFWPIPLKIQVLDKTKAIMETRRNALNVNGHARSPWPNGRFDT